MPFDHVFWAYRETPNACWLKGLKGFKKAWKIGNGISVMQEYPSDAKFSMDQDYPTDTLTRDHLTNEEAFTVVSTRLKEFLEARELPNVEYLPVTVFDHRGRPVTPPYFIVNPFEPIDCLDRAACRPKWNQLDKEAIETVEAFVVEPDKSEDLPPLFRAFGLMRYPLISRALAKEIDAAGFVGNAWVEPQAIVGIPIPADFRLLVPRY